MVRRLAIPAVTAAAVWVTTQLLIWGTAELFGAVRDGTAGLNEFLGLAAALAAWAVLAWVTVVLLSTVVAAAPGALGRAGTRVSHRLAPAAARNAARLAVGLAVTAGPVAAGPVAVGLPQGPDGGAYAQVVDVSELPGVGRPGQPVPPGNAREPGSSADDPSPTPDAEPGPTPDADPVAEPDPPSPNPSPSATRTGPTPDAGLAPDPVREADPGGEVVVQRGDTLWAIAARHLRPDATPAEIATEWPRWYAANRSAIGDDPDLILPGTILSPPLDS